jgi:hypothetical protein
VPKALADPGGRACRGLCTPRLSIAGLAALLPTHWELRHRDLHVAPLEDADLARADVALVSGMLIQRESMPGVLRRARALGSRTVVGGPASSTGPSSSGPPRSR